MQAIDGRGHCCHNDEGWGHGMDQVQGLRRDGREQKNRFWPIWDEAQQSLVNNKPLAEIARALQPSQ